MTNLTLRSFACAAILLILIYNFSASLANYICIPSGITSVPPFLTLSASSTADMANAVDPSTHLRLTLAQTSKSPPTLSLTVTNTHPSAALTFVTWNTPLDDALLPLGLLAITDPATGERLNKDSIKINRMTPPEADAFVSLKPGQSSEEHVVELRNGPLVPLDKVKGGKVQVKVQGQWGDVWVDEEVGPQRWDEKSGKGVKGAFDSGVVEVEV